MLIQDLIFKPLDKDGFAAYVLQLAHKSGYSGSLTYDSQNFRLEDSDIKLYLSNVYEEYRVAPVWRRKAIVAHYVRALLDSQVPVESSLAGARSHLFPRVRERMYFESARLHFAANGKDSDVFVYRVFAEHLTLDVAYDQPETIQSINRDQLEQWGLTFDEALAIASSNLEHNMETRFVSPQPGLYMSDCHDGYDASRMHSLAIIQSLSVRGRHVAMVPSRDLLIVTGADDVEGLIQMGDLAREALEHPRALSGIAFRLDAEWVPFLPESTHPAYEALAKMASSEVTDLYSPQETLLRLVHEKQGIDLFVAPVLVATAESGCKSFTFTTWTDGVSALLPRTDYIGLTARNAQGELGIFGLVRWEEAQDIVGDLMTPQGLYPERYRVDVFPSAARRKGLTLLKHEDLS